METVFIKIPTEAEIRQMVDDLIMPDYADIQAPILTRLMSLSSDRDDRVKDEVFLTATTHAFTKTTAFHDAYNQFVGAFAASQPTNDVIETNQTV